MKTRTTTMKFLLCTFLLVSVSFQLVAQTTLNAMPKNKQVISVLSIDAGASLLGGAMPNNSMLGNGVSASINAYFPVWKIKTTPTFKATFGLNVGIGVQSLSNRPPKQNILPSAFNIQNQSGAPILINKIGSSNWKTSALPEAGIQAELTVHNFNITPILNLGFAKFKGNTDTLTQKGSFNGKEQQKDIYTQEVKDIKGLVVSPKLRLGYSFKNVGIYVEGSYTFINSGTSSTSTFKPNGEPSKEGTYSIDQIISGSYIKKETTKKFNSYGIKFGISIPLGRSISEPGVAVRSDYKPKKQKTNTLVITDNNGGKGIVVGTGGNAKGINEAGIKVVEEQNEARKGWDGSVKGNSKGIREAGIKVVEEQNEDRKGWDGTVKNGSTKVVEEQDEARKGWDGTVKNGLTKIVEDNNASIRKGWDGTVKNGSTKAVEEQNEARKGWDGSVKGNSKGIQEAGIKRQEDMPKNNVKDLSTEPTAPQPQNQSIINTTKSNTKDKEIKNPEDSTSTSGGSSSENPIFEGTGSARPGNPIPGIIVKGGKNPGAQKITLTSNNNGEVYLNNLEIGSYAFEVSKPGQSPNGVIVKGEKISGGQMQIINNNNGKFEFTISEKGNYKIQFSTPNTNSKGIQEAGIK